MKPLHGSYMEKAWKVHKVSVFRQRGNVNGWKRPGFRQTAQFHTGAARLKANDRQKKPEATEPFQIRIKTREWK